MSEKEQLPQNPEFSGPPVSSYEPPPPYAPSDDAKFQNIQQHGADASYGGQPPYHQHPGQPFPQGQFPQGQFPNTYPQPAPTMTTVIVRSAPSIVGPYPVNCQCPHCNAQVLTETKPVNGTITWLAVAGCLLFGCWFGCCLFPFCASSLQDIDHRCPQCKHFLGRYRRL